MRKGGEGGLLDPLADALEWLYSTQWFGVKLGLEGMQRLVFASGVDLQAGPRFFHVAGTNGKGSTCAMLASICREAGIRTGLYTSPHLVSLRERFQFEGEHIAEGELRDALQRLRVMVKGWDPHPTFFELVTVLALEWFQCKGAEVVVLETGMGGRLDATNVVTPMVSVLTPVGQDHQQYLGATLGEIALEKAGIVKRGVPVVSAPQDPEVMAVFKKQCLLMGSPFAVVDHPWTNSAPTLAGEVQRWNAALAVAAIRAAQLPVTEEECRRGLAKVRWPGRFDVVREDLVLDGAHNPAAAAVLVHTWRERFGSARASVVFGALEDKDVPAILRTLAPLAKEFILVPIQNPRSIGAQRLSSMVAEAMPSVPVRLAGDVSEALAMQSDAPKLVTGSLYLVGEVLAHLKGEPRRCTVQ